MLLKNEEKSISVVAIKQPIYHSFKSLVYKKKRRETKKKENFYYDVNYDHERRREFGGHENRCQSSDREECLHIFFLLQNNYNNNNNNQKQIYLLNELKLYFVANPKRCRQKSILAVTMPVMPIIY